MAFYDPYTSMIGLGGLGMTPGMGMGMMSMMPGMSVSFGFFEGVGALSPTGRKEIGESVCRQGGSG
jgi:hypothetical protein